MTKTPADHAFAVFDAVVARPEDEWPRLVADACGHDPSLREEVDSLLAAHKAADGFLAVPRWLSRRPRSDAVDVATPVLTPGMRLGSYLVERVVGSGGMGQVYKARDVRLDRPVAIKVITAGATAGAGCRARFLSEGRAIARLSHPHICALYDIGHHEGVDFLVMEYLEGATLAARLDGGALPTGEAIRMAMEIADALEAAHASGIVHRDLKPGNVMITQAGTKLLDFGVARLLASPVDGASLSATSPATAATGDNIVLGTLQYMAPEQLEGKDVDTRSDVFAFGAVLFEMVTGRRAFDAESDGGVMAATLAATPSSVVDRQSPTPPALDHLIRTCLRKNPDDRWTSMHDVRLHLQSIAHDLATPVVPPSAGLAHRPRAGRWGRVLPWGIASLVAVGWVLGLGPPWRTARQATSPHLSAQLGVNADLPTTDMPLALSADGTMLAFAAREGASAPRLYVRRLEQLVATPLAGTDGAESPFFSPDGQSLAFFAGRQLKKVPVTGGQVVTLAEAPNHRGGWWAEDDSIVFSPNNRGGLMRVSSAGGAAHQLTELVGDEITHRWPQVLPGGRAVIYTASTTVNIGADVMLVLHRLPSGERTVMQRGGYAARYAGSGHVVYVEDAALFAMPFDLRRLEVTGPVAHAIDGVKSDFSRGGAHYAVSGVGTLSYAPGRDAFDARAVAWVDRSGAISALRPTVSHWSNPEFSPDGTHLAMDVLDGRQTDIWVHELARGTANRLTAEDSNEERPVWTSDGSRIVYASSASHRGSTLSWRLANGSGNSQVLIASPYRLQPGSWHPTRSLLAYAVTGAGTDGDVMILPVDGDERSGWKPGAPKAFVNTPAREWGPAFSPDGRWLAYHSTESGRDEVYVRPFPGPDPPVVISNAGGETPSWSRTRDELVYTTPGLDYDRVLMAAPYRVRNGVFRAEKPRPWASRAVRLRTILQQRTYALHPDGQRVAIARPSEGEPIKPDHLTFVLNFFDELRRIAPAAH